MLNLGIELNINGYVKILGNIKDFDEIFKNRGGNVRFLMSFSVQNPPRLLDFMILTEK